MKRTFYTLTSVITALFLAQAAAADVKIKSRQTMAGQSYESTTYIKGKRQRTESMNGTMVSLTQCDLRRSVQMNPNGKTYLVTPFPDTTQTTTTKTAATTDKSGVTRSGGTITTTITTKDTGERKQMFGFTARHLIITMETESSPNACSKNKTKIQTDGWYIDAEFVLDCDYGYSGFNYGGNRAGGCRDKYEVKTIGTAKRGYPVYEKMTVFDESGKETYSMVSEVVELSKTVLETALFDVPSDYREVRDAAQMYASMGSAGSNPPMPLPNTDSGTTTNASSTGQNSGSLSSTIGPKKPGVIRIGLATVKTGAVGDAISASDLSAAVRNTLAQRLQTSTVEVVAIDASDALSLESEARAKECDYVIQATASHKKGGGGFGGMFGQALGSAIGSTGIGNTGSVAGNVAGQVATNVIVTAATVSANVKSKDEVSLDLRLNKTDGTSALARVYRAKAKSDGEDIITQVVEQAAQAISAIVGR